MKNIGHVLFVLNELEEANKAYQGAVDIFNKQGQFHLAAEPMAGMAQIAFLRKDIDQAVFLTDEILGMMNGKEMYGPDRLLWIYLTCYQVLSKVPDLRALEILNKAHQIMEQRVESIPDESLRTSFIEQIQENKQIAEIWETFIKNH